MTEGVTHTFEVYADLAEVSAQWIDLFLGRHVVNPWMYPSTEPLHVVIPRLWKGHPEMPGRGNGSRRGRPPSVRIRVGSQAPND
jgi:hypothetical protein